MPILYESLGESIEDTREITIQTPEPEAKIDWAKIALLAVPTTLLLFFVTMRRKKGV